jgi:hypothetical protein
MKLLSRCSSKIESVGLGLEGITVSEVRQPAHTVAA